MGVGQVIRLGNDTSFSDTLCVCVCVCNNSNMSTQSTMLYT